MKTTCALALALLLVACGVMESPNIGDLGQPCSDNGECRDDLQCDSVSSHCVEHTSGCTRDSECPSGYSCQSPNCVADVPVSSRLGHSCSFSVTSGSVINSGAGDCDTSTECLGGLNNTGSTAISCVNDLTCYAYWGSTNSDCVGGYCGVSICTKRCSNDTDCSPMGVGACCDKSASGNYCFPQAMCDKQTIGQRCAFLTGSNVLINVNSGDCEGDLSCLGGWANSGSIAQACVLDQECVPSWGATAKCVNNYCGSSFCSKTCSTDAECVGINVRACCGELSSGEKFCMIPEYCPSK